MHTGHPARWRLTNRLAVARPRRSHARTTTQRGYGYTHERARAEALRAFVEGRPCPMCGKPMYTSQGLDLDHVTPMALGGAKDGPKRLVHRSCNRRAGAVLTNARRARAGDRVSRQW